MRRFIAAVIVDLVVEDERANEEDVKRALGASVTVPASMSLISGGRMTVKQIGVGGVREGVMPEQQGWEP